MLAQREAGANAKVIDGEVSPVPALPAPAPKPKPKRKPKRKRSLDVVVSDAEPASDWLTH